MDCFVSRIVIDRIKLAGSVVCLKNAYNALEHIQSLKLQVEKDGTRLEDLCIFLDIVMPYMNAGDFLNALDKIWPSLVSRVYIVSGLPVEEQYSLVVREDVGGFLSKPLTDEKVRNVFLRKELL